MRKSEHLNLNLFEENDPVLAENFNENSLLTEQALLALPGAVVGDYVPDHVVEDYESGPTTLTFDRKPLLVILVGRRCALLAVQGAENPFLHYSYSSTDVLVTCQWSGNSVTFRPSRYAEIVDEPARYFAVLDGR